AAVHAISRWTKAQWWSSGLDQDLIKAEAVNPLVEGSTPSGGANPIRLILREIQITSTKKRGDPQNQNL
ncbi:MAG: hypothetical protein V1857_01320, partial [archaeon]